MARNPSFLEMKSPNSMSPRHSIGDDRREKMVNPTEVGDVVRYEVGGATTAMRQLAGDVHVPDETVHTVAANKIKQAFLRHVARKATPETVAKLRSEAASHTQEAADHSDVVGALTGFMSSPANGVRASDVPVLKQKVLGASRRYGEETALADKKNKSADFLERHDSKRAFEVEVGATKTYLTQVVEQRQEAHARSSEISRDLMADATSFRAIATGKSGSPDWRTETAGEYEKAHVPATEEERTFLGKMEALAPHLRGSMYFNAKDQQAVFDSGGLFGKRTRELVAGGSVASKTTDEDKTQLGNHDHVFFFIEHEDAAMRPTRFAGQSSADGTVSLANKVTSDNRRVSFPLHELMHKGTWAMPRDFLDSGEAAKLGESGLPKAEDNIVMAGTASPRKAAGELTRQLGVHALGSEKLAKSPDREAELKRLNAMNPADLAKTVFKDYLRPQLMVPTTTSLATSGMRLDVPDPKKVPDTSGKTGGSMPDTPTIRRRSTYRH